MRAVCALGPLMSAFALLALGGRVLGSRVLGSRVLGSRVLGSRVLGSRWRSGLWRAPTAGMHRGSAPARRSSVAAVLAVVAVLRIHRGPGSLVDRRPGLGRPQCLRRPIDARAATALGERRPLRLPRPIRPLARRARAARRDHAVSGKHRRPWSSGDGGPPAVHRGAERAVGARHLLVLPLQRSDADMTLVLDR